jgi:ketosteroid isomerase-like protein
MDLVTACNLANEQVVAALDTVYQTAVRTGDVATIDRLLADDFVLVTGRGRVYTKADQLREARDTAVRYAHQEDTSQTVRVWRNTAVLTALLWAKGTNHGTPFDYHVWVSDTYVRSPSGWQYVFGQSSLPRRRSPKGALGSLHQVWTGPPTRRDRHRAGGRSRGKCRD